MSTTLVSAKDLPITLGKELGRGGEGSVYEVVSSPSQVAKVYHKPPSAEKQRKLSFMSASSDEKLLKHLAWPQETIHRSKNGPVIGFLMPKVQSKAPIHMVYSPAHRRQDYPNAAWDFLVYVARNVAACFETVHSHGHVVGDVNQSGVLVGTDSKVVLIDSDSFQITDGKATYFCEVGVSHFTPPELQMLTSFAGVRRLPNHDNFGLALLIFHTLFGGRHPYSGVGLTGNVGETLETDIKHFRYAYARDSKSRGISPPPNSIPLALLPESLQAMFFASFTEIGANGKRPTANEWVTALDGLTTRLRRCKNSSMHVYPEHTARCPWCDLAQQGVIYFLDLKVTFKSSASNFSLQQVWLQIQSVKLPLHQAIPNSSGYKSVPVPLPSKLASQNEIIAYRVIAIAVTIGALFLPGGVLWAWIVGLVSWNVASNAGSSGRNVEKNRRESLLNAAKGHYDELVEQFRRSTDPTVFSAKQLELSKLKEEYQTLSDKERLEIDNLKNTAEARQKEKFLDTIFIEDASIGGIGNARKAMLRSFGIETAADATRTKVMQVKGFGEHLTNAVLRWRAACEKRFVYDPKKGVSDGDISAVKAKYAARRSSIEVLLTRGPSDLVTIQQGIRRNVESLRPKIEEAAKRLSQAEADLSVF